MMLGMAGGGCVSGRPAEPRDANKFGGGLPGGVVDSSIVKRHVVRTNAQFRRSSECMQGRSVVESPGMALLWE
jgi:hypothetical protein